MDILERQQAKHKCYEMAQAVASSIDLCATKKELKQALDEMGFEKVQFKTADPFTVTERGEWRRTYKDKAQAVYIQPWYGVVKVVDYNKQFVDSVVVLSEHAHHVALALWYK